ncbi:hypothetical protein Q9189_006988 [Teloschistes chrysophthalmus]
MTTPYSSLDWQDLRQTISLYCIHQEQLRDRLTEKVFEFRRLALSNVFEIRAEDDLCVGISKLSFVEGADCRLREDGSDEGEEGD